MSFYWYQTKEESERDVCRNIDIVKVLDKYMEMCDNERDYYLALKKENEYRSNPKWNSKMADKLHMEVDRAYKWFESSRDQFWFARDILTKEDYYSDESRTEKFDNVCKTYRKWMLKNNYEKCLENHHDVKDIIKYIYTDHATEKHNKAIEAHLVAHYARIAYMKKKGDTK